MGHSPPGRHTVLSAQQPGFLRLPPLVRHLKVKVSIAEKVGLPFFLRRLRRRRMLVAGGGCYSYLFFMFGPAVFGRSKWQA